MVAFLASHWYHNFQLFINQHFFGLAFFTEKMQLYGIIYTALMQYSDNYTIFYNQELWYFFHQNNIINKQAMQLEL